MQLLGAGILLGRTDLLESGQVGTCSNPPWPWLLCQTTTECVAPAGVAETDRPRDTSSTDTAVRLQASADRRDDGLPFNCHTSKAAPAVGTQSTLASGRLLQVVH